MTSNDVLLPEGSRFLEEGETILAGDIRWNEPGFWSSDHGLANAVYDPAVHGPMGRAIDKLHSSE